MKSIGKYILSVIFIAGIAFFYSCNPAKEFDVLIVGGGASGTAAGIQAARLDSKTLIVEEFEWLGGALTSAGVSCIDGNYKMPAGIFGEFRDYLSDYYGGLDSLRTGWVSSVCAEPSVMNAAFKSLAAKEKNLEVWYKSVVSGIEKRPDGWVVTINRDGKEETVGCRILIDGTELGDIAKACGVKYDIGMDDRDISGEDIAPEDANDVIQDITYVAILKDFGEKDMTIEKPAGYDPSIFYCTCKNDLCSNPDSGTVLWEKHQMITYGKLPNNKYMINWPINGNDYYVNMIEMDKEQRDSALQVLKNFTLSYVYFMQTELGFKNLGLADDEYPTADKLPFIPYHRESRRIHGKVRFSVNQMVHPYGQVQPLYRTAIAVGDYPVDHHHARYKEKSKLPEIHFYPVPSFGLPLGTLLPEDVDNLIVTEKSISVTNIVNGATRLQPVLVQIGQAAGALAGLAVKEGICPDEISVRDVQDIILEGNGYLLPYLDIPVKKAHFKALQHIGATGILKGRGANVGWSNQTWFDADSVLTYAGLASGISDYTDGQVSPENTDKALTVEEAFELVRAVKELDRSSGVGVDVPEGDGRSLLWEELGLSDYSLDRPVTRKEFAVLMDAVVDPFHAREIDITGKFI